MATPQRALAGCRVIGLLGRGGSGRVWLGETADGRVVALKQLAVEVRDSPTLRRRLRRESRILRRVADPAVVALLDVVEEGGQLTLVLEYVDGVPLSELLGGPRLALADAAAITEQLCRAAACVHRHRIVHRDISPNNVLVSRRGDVKLSDFGLASVWDTVSPSLVTQGSTNLLGTPHYLSPEAAEGGRPLTVRSDVYSLGALAYHLFVGRPPFAHREAAGLIAVLNAHLTEVPPDPRRDEPAFDDRLAEALLGALDKDPTRRPPSAERLWVLIAGTLDDVMRGSGAGTTSAPAEGPPHLAADLPRLVERAASRYRAVGPPPELGLAGTGGVTIDAAPFRPSPWRRRARSALAALAAGVAVGVVLLMVH